MRRQRLNVLIGSLNTFVGTCRSMVVYNEQCPVLQTTAEKKKYRYNVWCDADMVSRTAQRHDLSGAVVRDGEYPTRVVVPVRKDVWNLDDLTVPRQMPTTHEPRWIHNGKLIVGPAAERFAQESRCTGKAHWWIDSSGLYKLKLDVKETKPGFKIQPISIFVNRPLTLYNADQFVCSDLVARFPTSARSRHYYGGEMFSFIFEQLHHEKAQSGLCFTLRQCRNFGLDVKPEARPIMLPAENNVNMGLYNVEQMKNSEELLSKLGRIPVRVPTFLISGKEIPFPFDLPEVIERYKSNYWLSPTQLEVPMLEFKAEVLPGEIPHEVCRAEDLERGMMLGVFRVSDLKSPVDGFRVAGLADKTSPMT